jgi:hypothetical protein
MERIRVPLLVTLARDDLELSSEFVARKASQAPRSEVKLYPGGHFDVYHGATFEQVAADQLRFLQTHLLGGPGAQPTGAAPVLSTGGAQPLE